MKTEMYLMANDAKWLKNEIDLPFTPTAGMDLDSLAGDMPLRISGMSYNISGQFFKIRLAWLSTDPLTSAELLALDVGWKNYTP